VLRQLASTNQLPPNGAQGIGAVSSLEPKWRDSLETTKSSGEWQNLQWKKWPSYGDWPGYLDVYESAAYLRICPKFIRRRLCIVVDDNGERSAAIPHLRIGGIFRLNKEYLEHLGAVGHMAPQVTVQRCEALGNPDAKPIRPTAMITSQSLGGSGAETAPKNRESRELYQNELWIRWPREKDWPGYLDVNEAAAFLRISPKSVRGRLDTVTGLGRSKPPDLPHNHLGRIYRIRKDVLITTHAVKTWAVGFD
jgi:hypothetical protein